jgi:thiol peroxidase
LFWQKFNLEHIPSVDWNMRSISKKNFNETAGNLDNTAVLCISRDLAQNVFVVQKD